MRFHAHRNIFGSQTNFQLGCCRACAKIPTPSNPQIESSLEVQHLHLTGRRQSHLCAVPVMRLA